MAALLVVSNCSQIGNTEHKTGWYLPEVAHPYEVFKNAGIEVTFVSPRGGKAPVDPSSIEAFKEDPVCKALLADKQWMDSFDKTLSISDVDLTKYKVIFFAGGHGPMFDFPNCDGLNKATTDIFEKGGLVAAVCHGVVGLLNVKLSNGEWLVKGHKVTSFTNEEEDIVKLSSAMPFMLQTALIEHGATFVPASPFAENVQVSECVFTGQNPASSTALTQLVVKKMKELKFC